MAIHESGLQNLNTGNGYFGFYQWYPSTWVAAQLTARVSFGASPLDAGYRKQTLVFHVWYRLHPDAWPQTGPACAPLLE